MLASLGKLLISLFIIFSSSSSSSWSLLHVSATTTTTTNITLIQSYDEHRLASVHINQVAIAHSPTQLDFESFCQQLSHESVSTPLSLRMNQTTSSDFKNRQDDWNDPFLAASLTAYNLSRKSEKALNVFKSYIGKEAQTMRTTNLQAKIKGIKDDESQSFKLLNNLVDNLKIPAPFCAKAEIGYCMHHQKYRTSNGACNNMYNQWWGMAESPYKRLLPAEYGDRINRPRDKSCSTSSSSSSSKENLPNARSLAISLYQPRPVKTKLSSLLAHFSRLIDFDVSLTPQMTSRDGGRVKCSCKSNKQSSSCFNILIPKSDKHNEGQTCMLMARSLPSSRDFDCNVGPREQMNAQTHWLDLSNVYGVKNELAMRLRTRHGGMLRTVTKNKQIILLPFLHSPNSYECSYRQNRNNIDAGGAVDLTRSKKCFLAGDPRTEFDAVLTSLHTVWVREHNRIAYRLGQVNRHWDDERLYQEARRLCIAIYQNVIYSEYLPALLGSDVLDLYDLNTHDESGGYFLNYKAYLYPQVSNEFHTAAFRFYTSMLSDRVNVYNRPLTDKKSYNISKTIFNNEMYIKFTDALLRGALIDPALEPRSQINYYFLNNLFKGLFTSSDAIKYSEPAINIQRGRDHGIPGYNKYRKLCGLSRAKTIDDFGDNMAPAIIKRLKQFYHSADDVDLFVGLSSEYPSQGSLLGPTASCIIAKTFRDLKYGDRFYFETNNIELRFSEEQLNSIRRMKMSKVLCQNSNIDRIQPRAFLVPNKNSNRLGECGDLDDIDFSLWKTRPDYSHYLKAESNPYNQHTMSEMEAQQLFNEQQYQQNNGDGVYATPLAYTTAIFHEYRPKALDYNPFVKSRVDLKPAYENIYKSIKPMVRDLYPDFGQRVDMEPTYTPRHVDHKWNIEDFYPLLEKHFRHEPPKSYYKPRDIDDFYPSFNRPIKRPPPPPPNHHHHHHYKQREEDNRGKYWVVGGPYESRYDDKERNTIYGREVDSLMVGNNKRNADGKSSFRRGIESLLDSLMTEKMKSNSNVKFIDRRDMNNEANRRHQSGHQYGYGSLLSARQPAHHDLLAEIKQLMADSSIDQHSQIMP